MYISVYIYIYIYTHKHGLIRSKHKLLDRTKTMFKGYKDGLIRSSNICLDRTKTMFKGGLLIQRRAPDIELLAQAGQSTILQHITSYYID